MQLDRYDGVDAEWVDHYQVVQCEGCKGVSFRHAAWFSDDVDVETGYDGRAEWLYPKRGANSLSCKDLPNVPTVLRRIYGEVIQCFNNDCLTLSAVGLRAVVEGVCADKSVLDGPVTKQKKGGGTHVVREGNLKAKIFGLHEPGILAESSAKILHEHRYLGNDAAHELMKPSIEELLLAIGIVEHTLEQLYEMPESAKQLKLQTAKRKTLT